MARELASGMGRAVAERTILRKYKENGELLTQEEAEAGVEFRWETWAEVADRVAKGNSLLAPVEQQLEEYELLKKHIGNATIMLSGRHLQHGDETQPDKPYEAMSNCSTSPTTFLLFYLLLNGSGVGRSYDDDMIVVNWDYAPNLRCVLAEDHADFDFSAHESVRDARHKYGSGKDILWHKVADTREGWAKALELWELAAFQQVHAHKMLILDFSEVRCKGTPIKGMQNRPASGPVPLMNAFQKAATLKGSGIAPWLQALYIDHYFAECVLVGGARRAARMSTKWWKDRSVLEFITIKRPIEFRGLNAAEITKLREDSVNKPETFLWSSNNSVMADEEFHRLLELKRTEEEFSSDDAKHARKVYKLLTEASYADGTGEPGLLNGHKFVRNDAGRKELRRGDFVGNERYQVEEETQVLLAKLAKRAFKSKNPYITNPCGEIVLYVLGGYCIIGDAVPYHAETLEEAEEALRVTTRALMRVNYGMSSLFQKEVTRTNRIGVSLTGVHEFAWKFFKFGFRDLIDEERSKIFWLTLKRFNKIVKDEAKRYAEKLGLAPPHTALTVKPAGTTSKCWNLTEGWHLPSMKEYLRWVQFRNDDPLVKEYKDKGYPTRELKKYEGTTIVGFPTAPEITTLGMGDQLVTASEATPEEQYRWIQLGEKYWIIGEGEDLGNQISYTLKYDPKKVTLQEFRKMFKKYQKTIRCCSVMPQEEMASYEYQPEQPVTKAEYEDIVRRIKQEVAEDVGREHLDCAGGACPIVYKDKK